LKIATYPIVCREDEKSVVVPILIGGRITGMEESAGKKGCVKEITNTFEFRSE
jgi:hypothetical protein